MTEFLSTPTDGRGFRFPRLLPARTPRAALNRCRFFAILKEDYMHQAPREAPRERVFIRSLSGRVALVVLFSSLAVAAIAVSSAVDMRAAVMADGDASASRLA